MKHKQILLLALLICTGITIPVLSEDAVQSEDTAAVKEEVFQPAQETSVPETAQPSASDNLNSVIIPPKWTDFCEMGYENAVYKDSHDVFDIFSFVKSERVKKNYWAERRVSFESYLKSCNALSDDAKATCYEELKKSEEQKNDLYKLKRKQLLYENNVDIHRR